MPEVVTEVVDPSALSDAQREVLVTTLYEAHCRIFTGVSREDFVAYVIESPAIRTRIKIVREQLDNTAPGRIVGYAAFHLFACMVRERRCLVVRGEVGLLPEYRRNTMMGSFMLREAMAARMRNPATPMYSVVCATNPASYRAINRYHDRVWPHWERPTPPVIDSLAQTLAAEFRLKPVCGAAPGVYDVGWCPRLDAQENQGLRCSDHPATRFYLSRNPNYHLGHGMLSVIALDLPSLLRTVGRLTWRTITRRRSAPRALTAASE